MPVVQLPGAELAGVAGDFIDPGDRSKQQVPIFLAPKDNRLSAAWERTATKDRNKIDKIGTHFGSPDLLFQFPLRGEDSKNGGGSPVFLPVR